MQIVERWILAALRKRKYFSLEALNKDIRLLLWNLNLKAFKKIPGSRQEVFERIDKPELKGLPQQRFLYVQWKKAKVNIDYHVELNRHYYSAPFSLIGKEVYLAYNEKTVEVYYHNDRVASHLRNHQQGLHTTIKEHMPKSHQAYLKWTPSRIISWASETGPNTAILVQTIMEHREHPEQGYRSCLGIMRLTKLYSQTRLEKACTRALLFNAFSYRSVESILKKGLDATILEPSSESPPVDHANIRGEKYYK